MSMPNEGMWIYNEYKEERRGRSPSSRDRCPLNPRRDSPRPQSFGRGASYPFIDSYAMVEDHFLLIPNNMDAKTAIMVPTCYEYGFCRFDDTEWHESSCAERCVKTCSAYEYLGEPHSRLARYAGRDPWTDMPLFERPSGPSLEKFLQKHRPSIYTRHGDPPTFRPRSEYLPLIYQWALQAIAVLSFSHKHDLFVGLFDTEAFWVSLPDISVSLIGFVSAVFSDGKSEEPYDSGINGLKPFHPFGEEEPEPTVDTDLFFYGTLVYFLMTNGTPDIRVGGREDLPKDEWPHIEREYLGEIVTKCWESRYQSAQEVKDDLARLLQLEGWEIEGEDTLKGFDPTELFQDDSMEGWASY